MWRWSSRRWVSIRPLGYSTCAAIPRPHLFNSITKRNLIGLIQIRPDIIHSHAVRRDGNTHMSAGGKQVAGLIRFRVIQCIVGIGGCRQGLIDYAVELLPREEMIVTLKENCDMVIGHQLMNGFIPAGTMRGETGRVTPFKSIGEFDAAASRAKHMMSEDEFIFYAAGFERLLEPLILRVAEGDLPQVTLPFLTLSFAFSKCIPAMNASRDQ